MLRKFASHLRDQWMGALALLLALSGGTAYAVTQIDRNSVKSKHIVTGEVRSGDVEDDGLTGVDIGEETLGQVPSAATADTAQDANTLDGKDSADFLASDGKAGDADKLDDKDSSAFALAGSEGWQPLSLNEITTRCNFVNYGNGFNPASYFRDRAGVVHLRGMVKAVDGSSFPCGTYSFENEFTFIPLPHGYRPANRELFTVSANNKPGRIDVTTTGDLVLEPNYPAWADAEAWFSLDGISFRCAPPGASGCP